MNILPLYAVLMPQGLREHNHGDQSWDASTHLTSGTPMYGREEGGYRISGALWSSA